MTIQTPLQQGNTGAEVEEAKVENMQESEINAVLALMAKKYGDLNDAADIYQDFLRRLRDRVGVVVRFMNTTTPK